MSDDPLVIAIDSSTSATKAVVVDAAGRTLSEGRAEIDLLQPRMNHYEHDARQWWFSTDSAVGRAVGGLSAEQKARVAALAITHQRESFVPVDATGAPTRNAVLWLDSRAAKQIREHGSDEIHQLSGKPADTTPALYKMIWLKENEPDVLAGADKVVDVHAYLVHAMTGRWVSSHASADTLALFDIEALDYSDQLLELAGVRRDQMAELAAPGDVVGELDLEVAQHWGLKHTVPVISGLGDGQGSGLGTAAIDPEVAYINIGTSIVAGVHSADYRYGKEYRTLAAGLAGQYVLEIVQNSGSVLANWFRSELGKPELDGRPDPELEAAAAKVAIGAEGLLTLPYWNAVQSPWWNPVASGAMVGFGGAHTRAHMYRSILEGTAYELRQNLAGMQRGTGTRLTELRATGGGSRSDLWTQILADTVGLPIVASGVEEVSAQGAAVLAMAHTGVHGDVPATARAMARTGHVTEPDEKRGEEYARWGEAQATLYEHLEPVYERLWELTGE
ncbi:xylulokinase [Georgenia sp. Z1344]|uniref:xylulokinase n=1 Tax=Georgenia sp. Z1344 TaxID=3416706 RepID=UPI003CF5D72E